MKDFDLRRMLSLINSFSGDTRELVLSLLQVGLRVLPYTRSARGAASIAVAPQQKVIR